MAWYNNPVTESFGESYGGTTEHGVDIGTPFHTPITNIYAGKVTDASCNHPWGCQVGILTNVPGVGTVIEYFMHLDLLDVVVGQTVNVGQQIGLSGGQLSGGSHPNSPSESSGPHTEFGFDAPWISGVTSSMPASFNPISYLSGQGGGPIDNVVNTVTGATQAASDTSNFLQKLQSQDLWIKVGLIVGGGIVVIMGLFLFVQGMGKSA